MNNELYVEIRKRLPVIESLMNKEVIAELMSTLEDNIGIHHFGLGLYIRNNILKPNKGLYNYFVDTGIYHKDDMSEIILKEFIKFLTEKHT